MTLAQYLDEIVQFLGNYFDAAKAKTYVLGLSGGVDSSLCAALAKKAVGKDKVLGVIIPIDSAEIDVVNAQKLCQDLDLNYIIYDGTSLF
ncbi:MAG: NAD(+) synthase, partial [Erysipelotrichia bacterium]|nr:NAD(+) synthase [Erysipelotrichia bacterium]